MRFNYITFFNYYTNSNNLIANPSNCTLYYYPSNKNKILLHKPLPPYHIDINGVSLYVSWCNETGDLYFSIPRKQDVTYWDDHFHFAYNDDYNNVYRNSNNVQIISFAKTVQIPNNTKENRKHKCNFRDIEEDLEKIHEIICTNHKVYSTMEQALSPNDLDILKELLSRPFIQTATGGNKKYKGKKIRIGPRGGKYVLVKGVKKYI
jgi:hypothetical protein